MSIYDDLEKLKKLFDDGTISQEEYEREKARILASGYSVKGTGWDVGIDENAFVALMHASQIVSSFIIPLILWLLFKDKSQKVDAAGKEILNFEISYALYMIALCITVVGIFVVPFIGLVMLVFIIIAIIKALNGEFWKYPLTIRILK